jgi:anti-sigma B factor antagonist
MDSSGIGALMRAFTTAKREGGTVRYFGATKRVLQLLKMVRLDTVLELADDEESALAGF